MTGEPGKRRFAAEPSPLAAGLLALVVMVQFFAASWLWPLMAGSWLRDEGRYRAAWSSSGFRGLPIDEVAEALNQRLPRETPIRLGPGLDSQGQWAQRLKEGLYPRRVQKEAPFILDTSAAFQNASDAVTIVQLPQGTFHLIGHLPPPPPAPVAGQTDFRLSWGRVLFHVLAAFGWGAALVLLLRVARRRLGSAAGAPSPPLLPAAALAAPVVLGCIGTGTTLAQRALLPWTVLSAVGAALGVGALALVAREVVRQRDLRARLAWVRHPETWGFILFAAVLVRHMSICPIICWDGRSIWLFRAKQLAYNGFLTVADAVNPENFFSHMEYPLLFPTWMAHFATSGPVREREIAVGAMLLHVALLTCLWWLARRRLGRWVGAAFVGAVAVVTGGIVERGYADGFLTQLLLIMMFALDDAELEPYGWLAALGAALTKREGLMFATACAGLFVVLHPRFRAKRWLPRLAPALVLLVPVAHVLWARAIGIKDTHAGAKLPATAALIVDRLEIIWSGVGSLARGSNPLAHGFAALAAYAVLEGLGRRSWLARMMVGTAVAVVAFAYLAMLVTPYDVAWQVNTAMERLLLHAVLAVFAAVLVALTTRESAS